MGRKGILFIISGPSGVGKGTLKDALLQELNRIHVSTSSTTRKPRSGEVNGKDYFFLGEEDFLKGIKEGCFLEWAKVYSNYYGTPREFVQEKLKQGEDILLEIDIQGAMQIKQKMPEGVFIFIAPPSINELASRLCQRGKDTQESIEKRLAFYKEEMEHAAYYDYIVTNDNLSEAVLKLKSIFIAERCRVKNINL